MGLKLYALLKTQNILLRTKSNDLKFNSS